MNAAMLAAALVLAAAPAAYGANTTATVNKIDENGVGLPIGTLVLEDTTEGMKITPNLSGLPPGSHGFHVHAIPDCGTAEQNGTKAAGLAAAATTTR